MQNISYRLGPPPSSTERKPHHVERRLAIDHIPASGPASTLNAVSKSTALPSPSAKMSARMSLSASQRNREQSFEFKSTIPAGTRPLCGRSTD